MPGELVRDSTGAFPSSSLKWLPEDQESVGTALQHWVMLPWNPGPGRKQRSTAVGKRATERSRCKGVCVPQE